jgi:uncharacterized protein (DUF302 family)
MTGKYTFGKPVAMRFAGARAGDGRAREGGLRRGHRDRRRRNAEEEAWQGHAPYRILGACNPQFAHRAIEVEPQIGALLPCNVVVREDKSGGTVVEIMDPQAVLQLVDRPEIGEIAAEVRKPLERVLAAL